VSLAGELGEVLRQARGERSTRDVARAMGVAPEVLGRVERGEVNPTLARVERLAAAYRVELALVPVEPCD
jgi:transcriptional regulator with XRE-family HTH domain